MKKLFVVTWERTITKEYLVEADNPKQIRANLKGYLENSKREWIAQSNTDNDKIIAIRKAKEGTDYTNILKEAV